MPHYIAIPGQYSGDMWHVVAACLVRRDLTIVVTILSMDDSEGAATIVKFFTDVGLGKRVKVMKGISDSDEVELDGQTLGISKLPGKRLMWQHMAFLQRRVTGTVHPLYRCTSMVMRAMEDAGREEVIEVLRAGFTAGLSTQTCEYIASYVSEILFQNVGKKLLFVLGRLAGYNTEHDLDEPKLTAIASAAKKAGFSLILVGHPKKLKLLAAQCGVEPLGYLDLRDWIELTGSSVVDERARAYFWRCLVELAPKYHAEVRFIGGRSGSTDLPAFMGMEVLCWDICDLYNPEYLRLLLTARLLLWVTHVEETLWKGRSMSVCPQGGIDLERDVLSFLSVRFVQPKLEFCASKSLTKKVDKLVGGLTVIEQAKEEVLQQLEKIAVIVFILPYDITSESGQHFRTVIDSSTAPLAFNALNHALRPYYTTQNVNLPDLGTLFYYQDKGRRHIHSATTLTMLSSISPMKVVSVLALKSMKKSSTSALESKGLELGSKGLKPVGSSQPIRLPLAPRRVEVLLPPVRFRVNDVIRVHYHLYYDVVGPVTAVEGRLVTMRVDHCYKPGTKINYASDHTAIVIDREMRWRDEQIDELER